MNGLLRDSPSPKKTVIDETKIRDLNLAEFHSNVPCPWNSFDSLLRPDAFTDLYHTFPSLDCFERHTGRSRVHGQRPHDRWYLALEHSIYDNKKPGSKGCIALEELPKPWREFIECVRTNSAYQGLVRESLGTDDFVVRCAWHVASNGCDVSPHIDDPLKAGTHIFYFNTDTDWDESWGGQTLFLSELDSDRGNPELDEFAGKCGVPIINNKSLLFKNTDKAWHGVAPISCPEEKYRRLFNLIYQRPNVLRQRQSFKSRLKNFFMGNAGP